MHPLRTTLATFASVAALGLAGCSSSGSTETPPPDTSSAAPTSETSSGVEISNPRDLSSVKDACQLLKPAQAQQLGLGPPKPAEDSPWGESSCEWEQDRLSIKFKPDTVLGQNISEIAKNAQKSSPDEQVDGYPVVLSQPGSITCGINVGVAEEQNLGVFSTVPASSGKQPCEFAKQAAGMAISNLQPES